jgi:hypothetical protein
MSKSITLSDGAINAAGDRIAVELLQPDNLPALVRIVWPAAASVCQPHRFNEVAAAAMKVLATAVTQLAGIKAAGKLR